ncbi:hypothetical protein LOK49_LG03G01736 [Camellia lanceoleosa]|uniref:Uncharacterized protein n=1 Tax=Camellia lanceoleosa TaxID=1840588 RepID=A0ACC0IEE1_9ERIC|nr:hypothetical protein LOK49_LG03G01736 [Camellia lanceoleosa]
MAQTTLLPLLLLRRLSSQNPNLFKSTRPLFVSHLLLTPKPFSSLSSPSNPSDPEPTSLSARMSFVFDQIDAIERERSQKDETLHRIRAWRESKKNKIHEHSNHNLGFGATELRPIEPSSVETEVKEEERGGLLSREVELVHPWPEWIELMERLVQQNYFDHRRKDEEKMVEDLGFQMSDVAEEGIDFTRDWKTVQTACLNFGRDRFDILRSLLRQDIQILVGYGCPSADKKVVFSAKLLRKHVHLDEGDVCSSCSLRNSCERAYLVTNKEDEARTIDVMRVLLTYGFDPVKGSVVNEPLLKIKSVKTVIRKLLHEVVKLSAVPIDPNLPPPVIIKPPPKVKQPPPPKKRVGRDDIEMKKGDWLCPKCDFMNFAKNTVCLQCDARRPKRQLLPGEWECPQCNFLNYRRNMVCFQCEHNRPPDEFTENQMQERQRGPKMRLEKVPNRADVSNAWNFDFDDDESDGADVAAFEHADSQKLNEDFPPHSRANGENFRGADDDSYMARRTPKAREREYSNPAHQKPGTGFDDFEDEEDDDVDSYELDAQNNNQVPRRSAIDFSEVEGDSESEDVDGFDMDHRLHNKSSKTMRRKAAFSGSEADGQDFDSDNELPVHPNWKSSHVADSRQRSRGKGTTSFVADEDYGLSSDTDDFVDEDFRSKKNKGNKQVSSSHDSRKRQIPVSSDESFSGLDSDEEDLRSPRDKRGSISKGRGNIKFSGDSRFGSNGMSGGRRKPLDDDFDRSSQGSRGNSRGFQRVDDYGGRRMNNSKGSDFNRSSKKPHGSNRGFQNDEHGGRRTNDRGGHWRRGGFNGSDNRSDVDRDFDDDRPRRQRINVR